MSDISKKWRLISPATIAHSASPAHIISVLRDAQNALIIVQGAFILVLLAVIAVIKIGGAA